MVKVQRLPSGQVVRLCESCMAGFAEREHAEDCERHCRAQGSPDPDLRGRAVHLP